MVTAIVLAACGGNDDPPDAADIIPDMEDLGLVVADEGRDTFVPPDQDMRRALYLDPEDDNRAATVTVYVLDGEEAARMNYAIFAEALANPPPEFFGAEAEQAPAEPLDLGDERAAYVTAQPDAHGRLVWTDIVRTGQVVFITQVLALDGEDHVAARSLVAERVIDAAR